MPPTKKPAAKKLDKEGTKKKAETPTKAAAKPAAKAAAKPAAPAPKGKSRSARATTRVTKPKKGDAAVEAGTETALEGAQLELPTPAHAHAHAHDLGEPIDADGDEAKTEVVAAAPVLSEEEQELSALYGDVKAPATAHTEYTDRQTADEDRPMTPEINARDERKNHWRDRRDQQRRQRRDERGRAGGGGGQPQQQGQPGHQAQGNRDQRGPRPEGSGGGNGHRLPPLTTVPAGTPPALAAVPAAMLATNGHAAAAELDPHARVGTPLGDAAATVFAQLRNGQPMPVRQLAQMMRKRALTVVEPEQLWPQLKAELLGDERSYRTLGLRPRIVYRGRDLFGPGPVATSQTADAEAGVAVALSRLAGATHRALADRIAKASPAGFERIIHAYLVGAGYRDIEWVKRLSGISYASAVAPGIERTVLISARSGDSAIDRRGIGELRVGVEAKNLVAGILFAAGELSEDAERELERAGRSVAVVCGDQLVAALIATGVGVVSSAAPLHYVDDQLLDELLAG